VAILPVPRVALVVMECADGISTVVPVATVARVRKDDVLMLVIADPISTAVGLGQSSGFSAQAAAWPVIPRFRFVCRHIYFPFRRALFLMLLQCFS